MKAKTGNHGYHLKTGGYGKIYTHLFFETDQKLGSQISFLYNICGIERVVSVLCENMLY